MVIYLVEDDINIATILKSYLENEHYTVRHIESEAEAMKYVDYPPHLWILDIMLEKDTSGFKIYDAIKNAAPTPTIFISARDQDYDKVLGLEQGADDYITKPFSPREVVLRVKKLMNRIYGSKEETLAYKDYIITPDSRVVSKNDEKISLSTKEFDLLMYLLANRKMALSRDSILSAVWEENYFGSDRVVDDLVRRLRSRMPDLDITTLYGYGYRLE
ncbi:MAG: response regulator transcription factor [Candidatus Izemoplasmataceae bacterium]